MWPMLLTLTTWVPFYRKTGGLAVIAAGGLDRGEEGREEIES
jgi:hypothetical protein